MAGDNVFTQVRKGMTVQTSDKVNLGKVKDIWLGTDPTARDPRCDEAICSRVEVRRGFWRREVLYIPYNAIADTSGRTVTLNVDAVGINEKAWTQKPSWIAIRKELTDVIKGTELNLPGGPPPG